MVRATRPAPAGHGIIGPPIPTAKRPGVFFVALVLAVAVAASLVRGGSFRRLGRAPLRLTWLLFVGVALQLTADLGAAAGWLTAGAWPSYGLLLASQLVVLSWIAVHWHLPGMLLIALGLAANAAVMAANGAMPVHPDALSALGHDGSALQRGKHMVLDAGTRLPWLADIWAVPPIRSVISVGDLFIAAGLVPAVHQLMTYRTQAERRGRVSPEPARPDDRAPGSAH